MNALSAWAASAAKSLSSKDLYVLFDYKTESFFFSLVLTEDSLWIVAENGIGAKICLRTAYTPGDVLELKDLKKNPNKVAVKLQFDAGEMDVDITFNSVDEPIVQYTTTLTPSTDLYIPFWPRDIIIPGKSGKPENTSGKIHVSQEGTRSGIMYFSMTRPKSGSVMYMQNLTALGDYNQQTETSAGGTVGGQWPEMGFALPATKDKPLQAHKKVVISDAFVIFSNEAPKGEVDIAKQYLDLLAKLYLHIPKPDTDYHDWPQILNKGLKDLEYNPGCWAQLSGNHYFNAYVSDYDTPPEIMVQLAVMLPLMDYADWRGETLDMINTVRKGLSPFYDPKLGVISRWHPDAADKLTGEEEQKKPGVMDSWYLHHPLLNLSRLALRGEKEAKKLFLSSLDYTIKVAHHFNYEWPVFYRMDTLEVLKAETEPGKGGEKDVPGLYSHVMLQAYELTGERKFLREAEKAAKKLAGLGFDIFYQANNTTFTSGALLRLYKITKNTLYLDLSYLCLANVFKNVHLWECNYGYGKNYPSFFAVFPLSNAPYTAVYEEVEVFAAFHDYLQHAKDVKILPSLNLLISEYIRNLVYRAVYYYPPMLPPDMLSDCVKVGEVDPNLWIALEDMQDGWEKCGQVGQEVYGAGNAFGIVPRHYIRIPGEDFMVFTDYPFTDLIKHKKEIAFHVLGDHRLTCKLRIIFPGEKKKNGISITSGDNKKILLNKDRDEYILNGDQRISIKWR